VKKHREAHQKARPAPALTPESVAPPAPAVESAPASA
jgi:hypothetical protein